MSGGHFDYQQYKLGYIADEIEQIIRDNDSTELDSWGDEKGRKYSKHTIEKMKMAMELLDTALVYVQRIDWLVSGDDSEESFHKRLEEDWKRMERRNVG
jgi:hypothetical protein